MVTTTAKNNPAALRGTGPVPDLNWPLMSNNIIRADLDAVIQHLRNDDPRLTQGPEVAAFEREWSAWLGVRHSVFVNSGSSANTITLLALKEKFGPGEVIVPTLTWVSDIAAVLHAGMTPVFVDINPRTLGMDIGQVLEKITPSTRAVFLTHILGYNALDERLLEGLRERQVPLIEDVCESHGATFGGKRLGSYGMVSNFSFYYAHHLSTIEGGMICTDDDDFYQLARMFRSHGLVRESNDESVRTDFCGRFPDLNPEFIFAFPAHNMRSTELNAILGRSQLKRLDANNLIRTRNLRLFLKNLDPGRYFTDFETEGSSNYAFTLVLKEPNEAFCQLVMETLRAARVEFRRGTSGGGNQLRQPYLRKLLGDEYQNYPAVNHVHFFGFYIGNYPDLAEDKILRLCRMLNEI
jgi:CDP-6-deoxy-D-xylo-4-hexulose-3-dehydrase